MDNGVSLLCDKNVLINCGNDHIILWIYKKNIQLYILNGRILWCYVSIKKLLLKKKIKEKNKFSHKKTSGSWGFTGKFYYITKREHCNWLGQLSFVIKVVKEVWKAELSHKQKNIFKKSASQI